MQSVIILVEIREYKISHHVFVGQIPTTQWSSQIMQVEMHSCVIKYRATEISASVCDWMKPNKYYTARLESLGNIVLEPGCYSSPH